MISQNIKVALLTLIGLLTLWLIIFAFIKVDVSTQVLVTFNEGTTQLAIDSISASYIQSYQREESVKIRYQNQYHYCHLINPEPSSEYTYYTIVSGPVFDPTIGYLQTDLIIDSLNIYQYVIKK